MLCAGSFHCVKRRDKNVFHYTALWMTWGGIGGTDRVDGRRKRVTATMPVNLPSFWGPAIVRFPCTDAVADEGGKNLVFKDTGRWDPGREWRGEETVRTATQLSQTEQTPHTRSYKTARKKAFTWPGFLCCIRHFLTFLSFQLNLIDEEAGCNTEIGMWYRNPGALTHSHRCATDASRTCSSFTQPVLNSYDSGCQPPLQG